MPENLIEIRQLKFKRGDRHIIDGADIDVPKGKITAIMGPSGVGKTTILRLIGGELQPLDGSISVMGKVVHEMNHKELFDMRRKMGLLFQSGALFTDLSVYDNVALPLREHTDLPEKMIRDLVLMKLEAVGLRGARDLMPRELSGGMGRRVALARAIALDPEFILYDEPFAGQDPISMGVIVQLIQLLNKVLGLTSIIVSHDVPETASIADKIYLLSGGKVVAQGGPEEVVDSDAPMVQQFMKGLPDGPVPFHFPANSFKADLLTRVGKIQKPFF